jgi:putative endonuclease
MYYVYILQSKKDNSLYIGYSTNLKERIANYKKGSSNYTRHKRPLKLIHYEVFLNKKNAKSREKYLKSGWGRKTITKLLKNYLE